MVRTDLLYSVYQKLWRNTLTSVLKRTCTFKKTRSIVESERIFIGNALNVFSGLAIPMSFKDKIRLFALFSPILRTGKLNSNLSVAETILRSNVRPKEIVAALEVSGVLTGMKSLQIRRYSCISHRLYQNPEWIPAFEKLLNQFKPSIHVSSIPELWSSNIPTPFFEFFVSAVFAWRNLQSKTVTASQLNPLITFVKILYERFNNMLVNKGRIFC